MNVAVITYVYNESVNLPIWLKHYGSNFGPQNLYVVDHGSNDGSTLNIGEANRIRLPRSQFDEYRKTGFVNLLHRSLLYEFDAVIYTDCDEIIVPDPAVYSSLADYMDKMSSDYVSGVGLNIHHIISREVPLDLSQPILSQRRYGCFVSAGCKILISRTPISWLPGFHCSDKPPRIDTDLFIMHLKYMDYGIAMARHKVNREIEWSEASLKENFGAHHRYDYDRFVREGFLDPVHTITSSALEPFDFSEKARELLSRTIKHEGFYYIPMNMSSLTEIPERFARTV